MTEANSIGSSCASCRAWERNPSNARQQDKGECRKQPPTMSGWPATQPMDWCRAWEQDDRSAPAARAPGTFEHGDFPAPIGIDFRYVRDHPVSAAQWITAARGATDIPQDLQPLLADPLAGHVTRDLPGWTVEGVCGDDLFRWAERFPGHNNGDLSDLGYRSILTYLDDDEMRAESEAARQALPADHPWRHVDLTTNTHKPEHRLRKA